jgi:hypothetical protein
VSRRHFPALTYLNNINPSAHGLLMIRMLGINILQDWIGRAGSAMFSANRWPKKR